MSFPNIPSVNPTISIDGDKAVNLLLASIAFEELGLSHLINAEAEKIQYAVGTLPKRRSVVPATVAQVIAVNDSAAAAFRSVIKNEMLLTFKLEDLMDRSRFRIHKNTAVVTAVYGEKTVSASDVAYYHTKGGASA